MIIALTLILVPLASFMLTGLIRRYALATQLLDTPNERSSHVTPTPRGGGLAVVLVVLVVVSLAGFVGSELPPAALLALSLGGGAVAAIGWLDDRGGLPARWRFLVHLCASILVLFLIGGAPALPLPGVDWNWGSLGGFVLVLLIAWVLNLYNFMDGIDGIAGVEAMTVAGVAALLLLWHREYEWALLSAIVALASAGFLAWNWPPAKIFLGDVGSGFLGFTLATLTVLTWVETPITLWPWLILLGVFIVDASLTLIRRAIRRERLHEAHRSHAYQHAARRYCGHLPVTVAVLSINIFWLAPWATAATVWPSWGAIFLVAAWMPLLFLGLQLRAGLPE